MDKQTLKSLERFINGYADMAREKMGSFEPYAVLKPVSMLLNRYTLEYWRDGWQHGKAEILDEVGWNDIVDKIKTLPPSADLEFDFQSSLEWLVCYHLYSKRVIEINGEWQERPPYAEGRAEQYQAEILAEWGCPWVEKLWNGDEAGEMVREFYTDKPQAVRITIGDLQKVAKHIPLEYPLPKEERTANRLGYYRRTANDDEQKGTNE